MLHQQRVPGAAQAPRTQSLRPSLPRSQPGGRRQRCFAAHARSQTQHQAVGRYKEEPVEDEVVEEQEAVEYQDADAEQQEYVEGEQQQEEQQEQQQEEQQQGSEAVATSAALKKQQEEEELVTQEVSEEVEVIIKPLTFQSVVEDSRAFVQNTNLGKAAAVTAASLLLGTFGLAVYRYWQKYQSAHNQRKRQVNRNKQLVEEISKAVPGDRSKLTPGFVGMVRMRTGFSNVEVFRKYMWYVLRERKFDQEAVDDLVALKHASNMKDDDVAEALGERAQRIYEKYGTLMLNTEGMTAAGIERKATCQALFRKLLYLTEYDPLLKQGSEAAAKVDLRRVFGATDEDVNRLRIVSLYDIDLEKAFNMPASDADEEDGKGKAVTIDVTPSSGDSSSSSNQ